MSPVLLSAPRRVLPPSLGAFLCLCSVAQLLPIQAAEGLSPAAALQAFETEPGFVVELVAAEPLIIDPVALAFEDPTRMYVAENRDYPTGTSDGKPQGRIALLIDSNSDGVMDQRRDFVTGLSFPNGVMCWKGGVIVTAAPDVWYFKDTNGDGVADVRERWLTGFSLGGSSQLRVNDPTLGPDGWIYFAGGLSGGQISLPQKQDGSLDLTRGDLRFDPETQSIDLTEGKSQFGLAFDDAGERFACMNRIHIQHAPLAGRYLNRNPHTETPGVLQSCPEIQENRLMTRYTAGAARIYPISANVTTADSHAGTYSAACAIHVYRGDRLPAEYQGAAFTCDPTGNLVRGDRLSKQGGTYAATRIHADSEALRSRDNWFRPVFLADGPDGALYIADMYRKTIEHPEYLPEALRKKTDFESGKTQGRIWRLRAAPISPSSPLPPTPAIPTRVDEAARLLESSIPWHRDRAWRWMVENRTRIRSELISLPHQAWGWRGQRQRLELLSQWAALTPEILRPAWNSSHPEVRRQAVQKCEALWNKDCDAETFEQVARLAADADPHVRFQVALTLGEALAHADLSESMKEKAVHALIRIALVQSQDPWTRAAIQSSLTQPGAAESFLVASFRSQSWISEEGHLRLVESMARQLGRAWMKAGEKAEAELLRWRQHASNASALEQAALLLGWASGAGLESEPMVRRLNELWREPFQWALRGAHEDGSLENAQPLAARLLGWIVTGDRETALTRLQGLIHPRIHVDLQTLAIRSMIRPWNVDRAAIWLDDRRWNEYGPAVRTTLMQAVLARPEWVAALLDQMEKGALRAHVLSTLQREQILKSKESSIQSRAQKLWAKGEAVADRMSAFEQAKTALKLPPASAHGHEVFLKHCSSCHRFNREGVAVGPDLFDIRNQPKETILLHIVIPELEIAPNFVNYSCETRDGHQRFGLLSAETTTWVTLRQAQGLEERIARDEIVKWEANALSLMPQELEKAMSSQDMADLLAYLKGE